MKEMSMRISWLDSLRDQLFGFVFNVFRNSIELQVS
jgi:hypothetical protein